MKWNEETMGKKWCGLSIDCEQCRYHETCIITANLMSKNMIVDIER